MFQTDILFGIPIYKTKIDPSLYDKDKLLSTIKKNYSLGPRNNEAKWKLDANIHMSYDDEGNSEFESMDYTKLEKVYENVFNNFVKDLKLNYEGTINCVYDIINYTVSNKDDYMNFHNHLPGDDFGCVHYLQLDKDQLGTKFKNTHNFSDYFKYLRPNMHNSMDKQDTMNSYAYGYYTINVEEDDMIIFPSIAEHGINKIEKLSDKLRITIATNLRLT